MTVSKKILLVDDNKDFARDMASDFRRQWIRAQHDLGHLKIDMAHSVEGALAKLQETSYNLIVIDRGLPWQTGRLDDRWGIMLAQSIKQKGEFPEISKNIQPDNRVARIVLSTGMAGYLGASIPGVDEIWQIYYRVFTSIFRI